MTTIIDNDAPTIETVNQNLLRKLNELIEDASPEYILNIAESVAKLNASLRNNQIFTPEMTEEEKLAKQEAEAFAGLSEGILVDKK